MPRVQPIGARGLDTFAFVLTDQALYMLWTSQRLNHGGRLPLCLIDDLHVTGSRLGFTAGGERRIFASTAPLGAWLGFDEKLARWLDLADPFDPEATEPPELW